MVDHSRGLTKHMQFNMNACLLKSDLVCQNETNMFDKPADQEEDEAQRVYCPTSDQEERQIYHLERGPEA